MIKEADIERTKTELKELEQFLFDEIIFCQSHGKNFNAPHIEKEWMSGLASAFNYSQTLVRCFLISIEDYKELSEDQFHYYVGKISIQHLLEVINKFEQIINKAIDTIPSLENLVVNRLSEKISKTDKTWNDTKTKKEKKIKREIIDNYQNKKYEQAFIRDTLFKFNIIDEVDFKILKFAWDIRNSMHKDFIAIKNINFTYPDIRTGKVYTYNYIKGEELYHPGDLLGFLSISVQIEFILLKVLQKFREE